MCEPHLPLTSYSRGMRSHISLSRGDICSLKQLWPQKQNAWNTHLRKQQHKYTSSWTQKNYTRPFTQENGLSRKFLQSQTHVVYFRALLHHTYPRGDSTDLVSSLRRPTGSILSLPPHPLPSTELCAPVRSSLQACPPQPFPSPARRPLPAAPWSPRSSPAPRPEHPGGAARTSQRGRPRPGSSCGSA